MSQLNALLNERLKKNTLENSKMAVMAKQSSEGQLSGFSGVFNVVDLNEGEKEFIELLLKEHATDQNINQSQSFLMDLRNLISITSEVKAISNQAAILHGERIKRAQSILVKYRDGAFSAWLIAAYGNRQTPYNFLQYYEFCEVLPKTLRPMIDLMPRQAIYTLASREGPLEQKQEIIQKYSGETKTELLRQIREVFPLPEKDKRRENYGEGILKAMNEVHSQLQRKNLKLTSSQKESLFKLLESMNSLIRK